MPTAAHSSGETVYRVDDLVIDVTRGCVTRSNAELSLSPLSFELLLALVRAAPSVVSLDTLMSEVWPGTVVSGETVSQRIKLVRDALGDDAASPRYIAGVRGRGYRIVAPVSAVTEDEFVAAAADGARVLPVRHTWLVGAGLACLVLGTGALLWIHGKAQNHASETIAVHIPPQSVAVLPFENLSPDKNNAYFADGIQDMVLTKLADIGGLKVISRTSTADLKSHPDDLRTIGRELGVATVLEGSVQKAGNRVLINVQLVNTHTDDHLWATSYTRTLDDIFGVEGEVAEKIAEALKAKLSPADTKRLATRLSGDPMANDLYLRAEYFVNQVVVSRTVNKALKKAIPLYKKAIARAPDFALAHARLSYAESLLSFNGGGGEDVQQLDANARAQAEQAMKLAPNLAESHSAIGYCDYYGEGDYDGALQAFAEALRIRPNDADALAARGYVLRRQGKFNEAIDALQQALTLDPRNGAVVVSLIQTYRAIGRYAEVEQLSRQALAMNPGNDGVRAIYVFSIALRTGDLDRALAAAQGNSVLMKKGKVQLLTLKRDYPAAITLLESIPDTADNFGQTGYKDIWLGGLYRLSGDSAQARAHYAKALPELRARLLAVARHPLAVADAWDNIAQTDVGLGKTEGGMAAIKASLAADEESGDHFSGLSILTDNAITYAEAGRAEQAVSLLDRVLATPGSGSFVSPALLWEIPFLDPIRKSPQFQALLKKYAKDKPVSAVQPTKASPRI